MEKHLSRLIQLGVVNQVAEELDSHWGSNDQTLAEFVIHLAEESASIPIFVSKISETGSQLNDSVASRIWNLVHQANAKIREANSVKSVVNLAAEPASCLSLPNILPTAIEIDLDARPPNTSGAEEKESRKHGRSRSRSRSRLKKRSVEPTEFVHPDVLSVGLIYQGKVTNILEFGCFVELTLRQGRGKRSEGLVHVSNIQSGQVRDIKAVVRRNQMVYVKILNIVGSKIGLSMRGVNQSNGHDDDDDHGPERRSRRNEDDDEEEEELIRGVDIKRLARDDDDHVGNRDDRIRPASPDRFDDDQLRHAGIVTSSSSLKVDLVEEDVDVALIPSQAPFLSRSSNVRPSRSYSPIRVSNDPDGSLVRSAVNQAQLSKTRREMKQSQISCLIDSIPKDLSKPWEDPTPDDGERYFAQDLRRINVGSSMNDSMSKWKQSAVSSISYGYSSSRPILDQRQALPICRYKDDLKRAIVDNQVIIVIAETGSGKTTQLPQYMVEAGLTARGMIGCTQPRRVAAISIAKRVSEEFGCDVGQQVGYCIRFEDCTSPSTIIKYMTDGMLMREYLADNNLTKYSVIMLDEAHERNVHTDVLFGLMKALTRIRPELKLLITSATLDAEKFCRYFFECPVFPIPGRFYPVELFHSKDPEADYIEAALITVIQIHISEEPGDVLVFLTGQEEIDSFCEVLYSRMEAIGDLAPQMVILPVYGALPSEVQSRIFEPAPPGGRKIIVATNIAEASLTIDGIVYVVDPGFCKQNVFNSKLGMDSLVVCPISQASAKQRAGRAGRTGPGKCYRLYTEQAFLSEMLPTSIPEIQRSNLGNIVLQLKAMGINDLLHFDFMDPPPTQTLINSMEELYALGALDDDGLLTRLGRKMAEFPLDPQLSKMLIMSTEMSCSDDMLTIVAMMTVENPFYRPRDKQVQSDSKKANFHQAEGDHLTLLVVYEEWTRSKYSSSWCHDNYVQARAMRRAQDIRKQLVAIMDRYHMSIVPSSKASRSVRVRKCLVAGFFTNAAKKDPQEGYKTLNEANQVVYIHPASALFNHSPQYVIYHELVLTSKEYMRNVSQIDPKWLVELAPRVFKRNDGAYNQRNKRDKIEPLFDRFNPQDSWRLSKRRG